MADRLVVRIKDRASLSWADDLSARLRKQTGLSWEQDPERGKAETGHTQGPETLILVAVLTSVVDTAVKALMHQAHETLKEWLRNRVDPPEIDVVLESDEPEGDVGRDTVGG